MLKQFITRDRVWIWSKKTTQAGEEIAYDYGKEYFEGIIKNIGCKCAKCTEPQGAAQAVAKRIEIAGGPVS